VATELETEISETAMPIKVACKCGQKFAAKDELAGKVVKCPKCKQPLKVGGAAPAPSAPSGGVGDLLDEIGFHVHEDEDNAQFCPACDEKMSDHALLCVKCGYNLETGKFAKGLGGSGAAAAAGKAEGHAGAAEMLLKKAQHAIHVDAQEEKEQRRQGAPIWVLVTGVVIIAYLALSLSIMSRKAALLSSGSVWVGICSLVYTYYWINLVVIAFLESAVQGLLFLFVPLYPLFYVITRWAKCRRPFLICVFVSIFAMGGWGLIVWSANITEEAEDPRAGVESPLPDAHLSCLPPPVSPRVA
jgi:hypothetical protein